MRGHRQLKHLFSSQSNKQYMKCTATIFQKNGTWLAIAISYKFTEYKEQVLNLRNTWTPLTPRQCALIFPYVKCNAHFLRAYKNSKDRLDRIRYPYNASLSKRKEHKINFVLVLPPALAEEVMFSVPPDCLSTRMHVSSSRRETYRETK